MQESWAFGPAPKQRWVKRHRVVAFILSFVLCASVGAFAAWVTGNVTTAQNGKGKVVSAGALAGITTTLPTDGEAATTCGPPGASQATDCTLYLKVNNASGTSVRLTALGFDLGAGNAPNITGAQGTCPGILGVVGDGGSPDFLVAGSRSGNTVTFNGLNIGPIPVGPGNIVAVPNSWGVNSNGDHSGCAGASVAFQAAAMTATFSV